MAAYAIELGRRSDTYAAATLTVGRPACSSRPETASPSGRAPHGQIFVAPKSAFEETDGAFDGVVGGVPRVPKPRPRGRQGIMGGRVDAAAVPRRAFPAIRAG